MGRFLANPATALLLGALLTLAIGAIWLADSRNDMLGMLSLVSRFVHVLAAMIWVGLVWFVNLVQFKALTSADEAMRPFLLRQIAVPCAHLFRWASHVVVASGALLLVTSGYLLDRLVFGSAVYVPTPRALSLWIGAAGGLAMWIIAHRVLWPNLELLLDPQSADAAKVRARAVLLTGARTNLVLAMPVTLAMIAAAHL